MHALSPALVDFGASGTPDGPGSVTLLLFYLALAVGVSFLCSLCEAALLTLSPADAALLEQRSPRAGARLQRMKRSIDRPLAAILTLNTISHTVGAAGVGAQSIAIFGSAWVAATSAVLTLVILVASEIIPKTVGAVHARRLAVPVVYMVAAMTAMTYPIVVAMEMLGRLFKGGHGHGVPSRDELAVAAELARVGGAISRSEGSLVDNMLRLRDVPVHDVMTPRTVVFMLASDQTPSSVIESKKRLRFSRIPLRDAKIPDKLLGFVLKHEIQEAVIRGRGERPLAGMVRPMRYVPETAPLLKVLEEFGRHGQHLFGVADEHGTMVGIVTLEDVVESILGAEIVDETDPVADMRELAQGDA